MANYSISRMVYLSLLDCGAINRGATPSTTQIDDGIDMLDDRIQTLSAHGVRGWAVQQVDVPLVANQKVYTLGPSGGVASVTDRPQQLFSARRKDLSSLYTTPLEVLSDKDYQQLTNKDDTGTPLAVWYDRTVPNGGLYVYLTPDATAASTYELNLTIQVPLTALSYTSTDLTFPSEWFEFLRKSLALEFADSYGVPEQKIARWTQELQGLRTLLETFDQDMESVYFTVNNQGNSLQ